jgi:hypothetical protein
MESDLFDGLCRAGGYQPDSVLSIRVNPREVVVVHVDATGDLRRAIHRIGDERRHRPATAGGGASGRRCGGGAAVGGMRRTTGRGSASRAGSTAVGVSAATGEPVARGRMRRHRVLVTVEPGAGERGTASEGRARR